MAYDATVRVGADTREATRQIEGLGKKLRGLENVGKINARNYTQPLGRITGAANEFTKSMEAANARVLAFGAAAGTIYQVQRAFQALVKDTIEVEYSLAKINTLLKQTQGGLAQTSKGLFDIARSTGQSFEVVAKAAEEFARQGLTAEKALVRTRDAMILVRLTGQDTMSAVMGLTAAVNGFNQVGLDTTKVLNKMSRVASNFAVSEKDLSDAFRRVSSVAVDAGVSIDELNGLITAAQQITARGGNVIGNSFKTILTRLQRLRNVKALEEIGVQVRDLEGNFKPAMGVLKSLAKEFDNLTDASKAQVGELIGGVFQINVLKAVMKDLGNEYGVATRAAKMSAEATSEAIDKNKQLNDTLKSLVNEGMSNFSEMAASLGKLTLEKPAKRIAAVFSTIFKGLTPDKESSAMGAKIGTGILKGLGDVLAGPGLLMITVLIAKLMAKFAKFAVDAVHGMTKAGQAMQLRANTEREIIGLLQKDQQLLQLLEKETVDIDLVQKRILATIEAQVTATRLLATVSKTITPVVMGGGRVAAPGGGFKMAKGSAGGFVPAPQAAAERAGARGGGYAPGKVRSMAVPGFAQRVIYNDAEEVRDVGMRQPAIVPPKGSRAAKEYDKQFRRTFGKSAYSGGLTPNFAANFKLPTPVTQRVGMLTAFGSDKKSTPPFSDLAANVPQFQQMLQQWSMTNAGANTLGFTMKGALGAKSGKNFKMHPGAKVSVQGMQERSLALGKAEGKNKATPAGAKFSSQINKLMLDPVKAVSSAMFLGDKTGKFGLAGGKPVFGDKEAVLFRKQIQGVKSVKLPAGSHGDIFEAALTTALGKGKNPFASIEEGRLFDFEEGEAPSGAFGKMFNTKVDRADAKRSSTRKANLSMINKIFGDQYTKGLVQAYGHAEFAKFAAPPPAGGGGVQLAPGAKSGPRHPAFKGKAPMGRAHGLVPNFALDHNRKREAKQAGVPYGQTYYSYVDTPDYSGTVVGNTRDEPSYAKLKKAVAQHPNPGIAGLAARGMVPNFADNIYRDVSDSRGKFPLFSPTQVDMLNQTDVKQAQYKQNLAKEIVKARQQALAYEKAAVEAAKKNWLSTIVNTPMHGYAPHGGGGFIEGWSDKTKVQGRVRQAAGFMGNAARSPVDLLAAGGDRFRTAQMQQLAFAGGEGAVDAKAILAQQGLKGQKAGMFTRGMMGAFGGKHGAMKGMGWMMGAPMAGRALSGAIGDETKGQRGAGKIAEGLGSAGMWMGMARSFGGEGGDIARSPAAQRGADWVGKGGKLLQKIRPSSQIAKTAIGFGTKRAIQSTAATVGANPAVAGTTLGGSLLIAGAIALAVEIPGIIQAFTDNTPDLLKSIEESTRLHEGYSKAVDGVLKVQSQLISQAGDLTKAQKELLESQLAARVAKLDPAVRKEWVKLTNAGKIDEATAVAMQGKYMSDQRREAGIQSKAFLGVGSKRGDIESLVDKGWGPASGLLGFGKRKMKEDTRDQIEQMARGVMGLTQAEDPKLGTKTGRTIADVFAREADQKGYGFVEGEGGGTQDQTIRQAYTAFKDQFSGKTRGGGQTGIETAITSFENFLKKVGMDPKQSATMIESMRNTALEANWTGNLGRTGDTEKIRQFQETFEKNFDFSLIKEAVEGTANQVKENAKALKDFNAHVFTTSEAVREFALGVDTSSKLFIVALEGTTKRTSMLQNNFLKMASNFVTPEGMAQLKEKASILAAGRSREKAQAKGVTSLQSGMVKVFSGAILQEIMATNRKVGGGGSRNQLKPSVTVKTSKELTAQFSQDMQDMNDSIIKGPGGFKMTLKEFKKKVKGLMEDVEARAGLDTGIMGPKDIKEVNTYRSLLSDINTQQEKYRQSMVLTEAAHREELKTIELKTKLEKELINIRQKLAVGGGIDQLAGTTPVGIYTRMQGIARSRSQGDLRGGEMEYANLLQDFGAKVPEAIKDVIAKGLANKLRMMKPAVGLDYGDKGPEEIARTMVDAKYKTDSELATLEAALGKLTDPLGTMADHLNNWIGGRAAPFVQFAGKDWGKTPGLPESVLHPFAQEEREAEAKRKADAVKASQAVPIGPTGVPDQPNFRKRSGLQQVQDILRKENSLNPNSTSPIYDAQQRNLRGAAPSWPDDLHAAEKKLRKKQLDDELLDAGERGNTGFEGQPGYSGGDMPLPGPPSGPHKVGRPPEPPMTREEIERAWVEEMHPTAARTTLGPPPKPVSKLLGGEGLQGKGARGSLYPATAGRTPEDLEIEKREKRLAAQAAAKAAKQVAFNRANWTFGGKKKVPEAAFEKDFYPPAPVAADFGATTPRRVPDSYAKKFGVDVGEGTTKTADGLNLTTLPLAKRDHKKEWAAFGAKLKRIAGDAYGQALTDVLTEKAERDVAKGDATALRESLFKNLIDFRHGMAGHYDQIVGELRTNVATTEAINRATAGRYKPDKSGIEGPAQINPLYAAAGEEKAKAEMWKFASPQELLDQKLLKFDSKGSTAAGRYAAGDLPLSMLGDEVSGPWAPGKTGYDQPLTEEEALRQFQEDFKETFGKGGTLEKGKATTTLFRRNVGSLAETIGKTGMRGEIASGLLDKYSDRMFEAHNTIEDSATLQKRLNVIMNEASDEIKRITDKFVTFGEVSGIVMRKFMTDTDVGLGNLTDLFATEVGKTTTAGESAKGHQLAAGILNNLNKWVHTMDTEDWKAAGKMLEETAQDLLKSGKEWHEITKAMARLSQKFFTFGDVSKGATDKFLTDPKQGIGGLTKVFAEQMGFKGRGGGPKEHALGMGVINNLNKWVRTMDTEDWKAAGSKLEKVAQDLLESGEEWHKITKTMSRLSEKFWTFGAAQKETMDQFMGDPNVGIGDLTRILEKQMGLKGSVGGPKEHKLAGDILSNLTQSFQMMDAKSWRAAGIDLEETAQDLLKSGKEWHEITKIMSRLSKKFWTFNDVSRGTMDQLMNDPKQGISGLTKTFAEQLGLNGRGGGPEKHMLATGLLTNLSQWVQTMDTKDWKAAGSDLEQVAEDLLSSTKEWREITSIMKTRTKEIMRAETFRAYERGDIGTRDLAGAIQEAFTTKGTGWGPEGRTQKFKSMESFEGDFNRLFGENEMDKRKKMFPVMNELVSIMQSEANYMKVGSPQYVSTHKAMVSNMLAHLEEYRKGNISMAAVNQGLQDWKDAIVLMKHKTGRVGRDALSEVVFRRAETFRESRPMGGAAGRKERMLIEQEKDARHKASFTDERRSSSWEKWQAAQTRLDKAKEKTAKIEQRQAALNTRVSYGMRNPDGRGGREMRYDSEGRQAPESHGDWKKREAEWELKNKRKQESITKNLHKAKIGEEKATENLTKARKDNTKAQVNAAVAEKKAAKAAKKVTDEVKKLATAATKMSRAGLMPVEEIFGGGKEGTKGAFPGLYQTGGWNPMDVRKTTMGGIRGGMDALKGLRSFVDQDKWQDDPRRIKFLEQMQSLGKQWEDNKITEAQYQHEMEYLIKDLQDRVIRGEQIKQMEQDFLKGRIGAGEYYRSTSPMEKAKANYFAGQRGDPLPYDPAKGRAGFGAGMQGAVTQDPWEQAGRLEELGAAMMNDFKGNFKEAIQSMINGTKSFKEAARDFALGILESISSRFIDHYINEMFSKAFGKDSNPLGPETKRDDLKKVIGPVGPYETQLKEGMTQLKASFAGLSTTTTALRTTADNLGIALENGKVAIVGGAEAFVNTVVPSATDIVRVWTGGVDYFNRKMIATADAMALKLNANTPLGVETPKNRGGYIKRLNSGGIVTGGSGLKDDVPALMQGGEYVIRRGSVKKYGANLFAALNQGQMYARGGKVDGPSDYVGQKGDLKATTIREKFLMEQHGSKLFEALYAGGGYVGKKGSLKATTIREKFMMKKHGAKIFDAMHQVGKQPAHLSDVLGGANGYAKGGEVEEMDGLGPKARLASERATRRATDSELIVFKAQYLDPLGQKVRGTSVRGLQRKAVNNLGFSHEQVYGKRGTMPQKRFLGGLLQIASMGMALFGAAQQPDSPEIKMAGPEYGSQKEMESSFRHGFGAQPETTLKRKDKGIDVRVANAAMFLGSDPRQPTGMEERVGVAGRMSPQQGGIASAQAFDPSKQNALDQMREARKDAWKKRQDDIKDFEERKANALSAYKRQRRSIATQAIMGAAFSVGSGMKGSASPTPQQKVPDFWDSTSMSPEDFKDSGVNINESGIPNMNRGGLIRRAGGGGISPTGKDNIRALLTGGEYVLSPDATRRIGVHTLHKMNAGSWQPEWSAGSTGRSMLGGGGHVRGYQAGGLVGPNVGITAGMDSDAAVSAINKLVTTTESVKQAIVAQTTAMTSPTQQGQAMQEGIVGGGATTNNITFHINVEGNGNTRGGAGNDAGEKDDAGNEEGAKEQRKKDMKEFSESLEMAVLKVIVEQKRPGGLLYNPRQTQQGF